MPTRRDFLAAGAQVGLGVVLAQALPGISFAALPGAGPFHWAQWTIWGIF